MNLPHWLTVLAQISLTAAGGCAVAIVTDLLRRRRTLWLTDLAWPLITLWAGPLGLWVYFRLGHPNAQHREHSFWPGLGLTRCQGRCSPLKLALEGVGLLAPVTLLEVWSPPTLPRSGAVFWFLLQLALLGGFLLSDALTRLRRGHEGVN